MSMLISLFVVAGLGAPDVSNVSAPLIPGLTRAEVWIADTAKEPRAVLILCPGNNESSESMVRDREWQEFASRNNLGLVGLSYASPEREFRAGKGYVFPEQGSGDLLLNTLQARYGKSLPLLMHGFSSGAYFTELFVAWKPARVLAWAAHATGRFEEYPALWPPGVVSCGQLDGIRYGAALTHFKKGRRPGNRLLWIGIPREGHTWPPPLHAFVRQYFEALLNADAPGVWMDIDSEARLTEDQARQTPALSAWLPSAQLESSWMELNEP